MYTTGARLQSVAQAHKMSLARNVIVALETCHCQLPAFTFPADEEWEIQAHDWTSRDVLHERIKDATVIITTTVPLTEHELTPDVTPKLRLVMCWATGTNHVDLDFAASRGIRVCNCPSANIESVSEHAIALYFAARRRLVPLHNATKDSGSDGTYSGQWKAQGSLRPQLLFKDGTAPLVCSEETMGIIGYGALGKRIATLGKALGMTVVIAERKGGAVLARSSSSINRSDRTSFDEVLKKATVLVLCCPLSKETMNMISTEELKTMSPYALLINVSRGGVVDEQAILTAVKEDWIAGAATDVFAVEPTGRGDSPLLSEAASGLNITVSPHLAWCAGQTLKNLKAGLKKTVEAWWKGEDINVVV